jgi:hypothetical protein
MVLYTAGGFRGERPWFTVIRGGIATLLLVVIGVYAVQMLIIGPLDETELLPVGSFRSFNLTQDFPRMQDVTLNVVVVCYFFCFDKLFSNYGPVGKTTTPFY